MVADFLKNRLRLPRSMCMSFVSLLFIVSQVMVFSVDEVKNLWKGSALLGFAYGSLFGLFPTMTIEWFGLRKSFPPSSSLILTAAHSTLLGELGIRIARADGRREHLLSHVRPQSRRARTVGF